MYRIKYNKTCIDNFNRVVLTKINNSVSRPKRKHRQLTTQLSSNNGESRKLQGLILILYNFLSLFLFLVFLFSSYN